MRVLYISNYHEISGYSTAARDYILALDAVGVDVVPRRISMTGKTGEVPYRILELEKKRAAGCDYVIQHTLPHLFEYSGRFKKNVGLFAYETDSFHSSGWQNKLNLMDEVWVICSEQLEACKKSGVQKPTKVLWHAINIEKFQSGYEKLKLPVLNGTFLFYTVCEFNRRKNLAALIKAFHLEFRSNEPTMLVIKSSVAGQTPEQSQQIISHFCNEVKQGLNVYPSLDYYKPEIIISHSIPEEEMMRLHTTCDCFVLTSYGEAFGLGAFDALGLGKPVISNKVGGLADVLDNDCAWLIENQDEPVFGMQSTCAVPLYSATENWKQINIPQLRQAMREVYENKEERGKRGAAGVERVLSELNYETIGRKMVEYLQDDNSN